MWTPGTESDLRGPSMYQALSKSGTLNCWLVSVDCSQSPHLVVMQVVLKLAQGGTDTLRQLSGKAAVVTAVVTARATTCSVCVTSAARRRELSMLMSDCMGHLQRWVRETPYRAQHDGTRVVVRVCHGVSWYRSNMVFQYQPCQYPPSHERPPHCILHC